MNKAASKKKVPEMVPTKKWLSKSEAMAYMDLGEGKFMELATSTPLTTSSIGRSLYFKVVELDQVFEDNIFLRQPRK